MKKSVMLSLGVVLLFAPLSKEFSPQFPSPINFLAVTIGTAFIAKGFTND